MPVTSGGMLVQEPPESNCNSMPLALVTSPRANSEEATRRPTWNACSVVSAAATARASTWTARRWRTAARVRVLQTLVRWISSRIFLLLGQLWGQLLDLEKAEAQPPGQEFYR